MEPRQMSNQSENMVAGVSKVNMIGHVACWWVPGDTGHAPCHDCHEHTRVTQAWVTWHVTTQPQHVTLTTTITYAEIVSICFMVWIQKKVIKIKTTPPIGLFLRRCQMSKWDEWGRLLYVERCILSLVCLHHFPVFSGTWLYPPSTCQ